MIGRFLEWFITRVLARLFRSRYRELARADGRVFFRQFKICAFGKEEPRGVPPENHFSIFLQSFLLGDDPGEYHIHRWRQMISFGLSGVLTEDRGDGDIRERRAPFVYMMDSDVVHRAHAVAPHTWTLFVMIGRNDNEPKGGWGYFNLRPAGLRGIDHDGPFRKWSFYRPWNEVRSADVAPLKGLVK